MPDDVISLYSVIGSESIEEVAIDVTTREMLFPSNLSNLGVVMDHNVKKIFFRCPRYYNECDFSTFAIKINYLNAGGKGDSYPVGDIEISSGESDEITFSWLVHKKAVEYKGYTYFIVKMVNVVDGNEVNAFHTTLGKLPVLDGLETNTQIEELYPAEIEGILQRLNDLENSDGGGGTAREIELQVSNNVIQYRYTGDTNWKDLFEMDTLPSVRYTEQSLSNVQKIIARINIGAVGAQTGIDGNIPVFDVDDSSDKGNVNIRDSGIPIENIGDAIVSGDIVDNLLSTSDKLPLSANMGRALAEMAAFIEIPITVNTIYAKSVSGLARYFPAFRAVVISASFEISATINGGENGGVFTLGSIPSEYTPRTIALASYANFAGADKNLHGLVGSSGNLGARVIGNMKPTYIHLSGLWLLRGGNA